MASCSEMLAEAREALHGLLVGKAVVTIAFEGERTEFQRADLPKLRSYIRDLEAECGADTTASRRVPARVLY